MATPLFVGAEADDHPGKEDAGSAYVFVLTGPTTWSQQTKLTTFDAAEGDLFGGSVAISGDTVVVGAAGKTFEGKVGSAHVFVRTGTTWAKQGKLTAFDGANSDHFGRSVSIDGDMAVVGADGDQHTGDLSGSAYVFARAGATWLFDFKLTASEAVGAGFGRSVAISGDTVVVGAHLTRNAGSFNAGAAFVFKRVGFQTWEEEASITASDVGQQHAFGVSVSISSDANTVVIGAADDFTGCCPSGTGAAYIFTRDGSSWSQLDKLGTADATDEDQFGVSVSISGEWIIVGADGIDAAYVFNVTPPAPKLTGSAGAAGDNFGRAVAISGNTMVAGADRDGAIAADSGAAYIFQRGSPWNQQALLKASDAALGDRFGSAVSIDGDTAVVGAFRDDDLGFDSGSIYVYTVVGSTWNEQDKPPSDDGAANDRFGVSVAISGDTIVAGAPGDDDVGESSGSAYVFVRSGATWSQQAKLTASVAASLDFFGGSVAISGDTIVVGAIGDDEKGPFAGAAYVFVRNETSWSQQAKVTGSDAAASDFFGNLVAINGDTIVASAPESVYVFVRSGTSWSQQTKLTAADGESGDLFGSAVSISGDTVVVGASGSDDVVEVTGEGTFGDSGSGYVFQRNGTTWSQQAKLTAVDSAAGDAFGAAIFVDGDTVVVGADLADGVGIDSGATYVYDLSVPAADLSVSSTASPDLPTVGSNVTFTITVTNNGPALSTEVGITGALSGGANVISSSATQGMCAGASCSLGDIPSSSSVTVTIVVIPTLTSTISNTARVISATADPNPVNNIAVETSTIQVPQDNTLTGTAITVQPVDFRTGEFPTELVFADVIQPGFTSLVTGFSGPVPPEGFIQSDPPLYIELATTAEFAGPVTLNVDYSGLSFSGDESDIKLFHLEDALWVDRTASLDTANDLISADVASLASFSIFEPAGMPPTLQSLAVISPNASILVGAVFQFTATGTFSDSTTQDLTATATWSSSDTRVVTITSSGLATGVAVGNATITATDPSTSISDTAALMVVIPTAVPSVSHWGLMGMAGLFSVLVLAGVGWQMRARRNER